MDPIAVPQTQKTRARNSLDRAFTFASLKEYSAKERLLIRLADLAFFILIGLIGKTVRWEVEGNEYLEAVTEKGSLPILTFWHNRVFLATYFFRNRRIVVMTSKSFDGEYIARFIQRFGYGAARGSSTRGGIGAIVEMARLMRAGCPTAFTIDGPKGPPNVAKMGAVLLAKKTGHPVVAFTITAAKHFSIKSWDRLQIPFPFTRALTVFAPPIHVPSDADEQALQAKRDELQTALESLCGRGDDWRNG
jgi:lysophospholipid acyltransferase (LPLAT)-like uncharacterized protein